MLLSMYTKLQTLEAELRNQDGATAVEYGLLVALIAGAIMTIVATLGDDLVSLFTDVDTNVKAR